MANLKDSHHFSKYNDYYTPDWVWDKIEPVVKQNGFKTIYEGCLLGSYKSNSPHYWKKKGYNVKYNFEWDFLTDNLLPDEYDCIITNPPFETDIKKKILWKLVELDKPFILIMNVLNVFSNYFYDIFKDKKIDILYPRGKLHFQKLLENGELEEKDKTSFYSVFVCYKINTNSIFLN